MRLLGRVAARKRGERTRGSSIMVTTVSSGSIVW